MDVCFVIQPFDAGKYDKRYGDVYRPAIENAGLEPYRVDQDASVEVPIDAIERGIKDAAICLADITSDNPNVWYELGYAFASGRPVVMVCSNERAGYRYPFDIQHRTVLAYAPDAPRDFDVLRESITERIRALLDKVEVLRQIAETEQVAPVEGLSQPELIVLAALGGKVMPVEGHTSIYPLKNDVERAGLTSLGFSLGLRRLLSKRFVELAQEHDYNGEPYEAVAVTEKGWWWIEANESLFVLRKNAPKSNPSKTADDFNDEIPF